MDINETLAEMFLKDHQAMREGEAEALSQVQVLADFLIYISQRKTGCKLVDMRLVKDPIAKAAADELSW
jgi:hypothetical protein